MTKLAIVAPVVAVAVLATPALAGDLVPYRGSDNGTFQITGLCADGDLLTEDVAYGHGTHVGAYQLVARECIDPLTFAVTRGAFTLIAANGDTIFGTYEGHAELISNFEFAYDVSGRITGGTGGFAGATGALDWHGWGSFATGQLSDVVVGQISSPGAAKR
jgi:hypothetical protein